MFARILTFLFLTIGLISPLPGQNQVYQTQPLASGIHTIEVKNENNEFFPPLIELDSNDRIIISFDELAEDVRYMSYSLIHCNADWRPSALSELEYLDGFNTNPVENYDFSSATFAHYVHYQIELPNESVRFKVSGNYVLLVYPENQPEKVLLQACFSVYERLTTLIPSVSSRTDIDYNREHQQVTIDINTSHFGLQDPYNELKIYVSQNGRRDNEVLITRPMMVQGNNIRYEHMPSLIFEAGNEYRRFETTNLRYAGMGIENIRYYNPYYHATLFPALPRVNGNYTYDKTQYGRFVIRQTDADNSDLESDYFVTHFSLETDHPLNGDVYIDGELTNHLYNENSRMTWNPATNRYEKALLLKQGSYNYNYLFIPHNKSKATPAFTEGNYYETVNEYLVKVYQRPIGARYDRLIGVAVSYSGV